jgi:DMSO/TMAO reductase YedYZ molybdopterin-dependent catalytic subunit
VGGTAALVVVALMLALRTSLGVASLPDVAADAMTLVLPGSVFGYLIDRLQHFGRPLMLVGLAGGLVALAAVMGAVVARFLRGATALARGLIAAAAMSALTLPVVFLGASEEQLLGVVATTIAYWCLYAVLLTLGLSPAADAPLRSSEAGPTRRSLLFAAGAIGGAWLAYYFGGRLVAATVKEPAPVTAPATALPAAPAPAAPATAGAAASPAASADPLAGLTGISPTKDFYLISKNGVDDPQISATTWRLRVDGTNPFTLTYEDLRALEAVESTQTLECISNNVGGPLMSTAVFRGPRLRTILERAGVPASASEIRFSCADGYTESLPLDVAMHDRTILAYLINGEALPREHGFPARLLLSGRYGMKNPKWVTSIGPVAQPYQGYWEQRGWNKDAFVRTMSRLDFPQEQDVVPVGKPFPQVRGVAYAGARGISKVEISFDSGRTWDATRLRQVLPPYDWTFFSYEWTPAAPGTYAAVVRATDGDGQLQDPTERDSFPDGATGYHRVNIKVA